MLYKLYKAYKRRVSRIIMLNQHCRLNVKSSKDIEYVSHELLKMSFNNATMWNLS